MRRQRTVNVSASSSWQYDARSPRSINSDGTSMAGSVIGHDDPTLVHANVKRSSIEKQDSIKTAHSEALDSFLTASYSEDENRDSLDTERRDERAADESVRQELVEVDERKQVLDLKQEEQRQQSNTELALDLKQQERSFEMDEAGDFYLNEVGELSVLSPRSPRKMSFAPIRETIYEEEEGREDDVYGTESEYSSGEEENPSNNRKKRKSKAKYRLVPSPRRPMRSVADQSVKHQEEDVDEVSTDLESKKDQSETDTEEPFDVASQRTQSVKYSQKNGSRSTEFSARGERTSDGVTNNEIKSEGPSQDESTTELSVRGGRTTTDGIAADGRKPEDSTLTGRKRDVSSRGKRTAETSTRGGRTTKCKTTEGNQSEVSTRGRSTEVSTRGRRSTEVATTDVASRVISFDLSFNGGDLDFDFPGAGKKVSNDTDDSNMVNDPEVDRSEPRPDPTFVDVESNAVAPTTSEHNQDTNEIVRGVQERLFKFYSNRITEVPPAHESFGSSDNESSMRFKTWIPRSDSNHSRSWLPTIGTNQSRSWLPTVGTNHSRGESKERMLEPNVHRSNGEDSVDTEEVKHQKRKCKLFFLNSCLVLAIIAAIVCSVFLAIRLGKPLSANPSFGDESNGYSNITTGNGSSSQTNESGPNVMPSENLQTENETNVILGENESGMIAEETLSAETESNVTHAATLPAETESNSKPAESESDVITEDTTPGENESTVAPGDTPPDEKELGMATEETLFAENESTVTPGEILPDEIESDTITEETSSEEIESSVVPGEMISGQQESNMIRGGSIPIASQNIENPTPSPSGILTVSTPFQISSRITPTVVSPNDDAQNTTAPSQSLKPETAESKLRLISGQNIDVASTPQNKAYDWLMNEDPADLDVDSMSTEELSQRYIAALLYFSFDGGNWFDQYDFLSELHVCNWNNGSSRNRLGVICDSSDKITGFAINENNLRGQIPEELLHLTTLSMLQFRANYIQGTLPNGFEKLSMLQEIDLRQNELIGTVPEVIFNLPQIKRILLLRNTELNGTIPDSIDKASNLEMLSFQKCDFTGTIPSTVGNLSNLFFFTFMENMLTGSIPESVTKLSLLEVMELSGNQLTGNIPEFTKHDYLYFLSLFDNKLIGTIPSSLGDLPKLMFLDIRNNQLDGSIPPSIGNLPELVTFYAQNNGLTGTLPSFSGNNGMLQAIHLSDNELSGEVVDFFHPRGPQDRLITVDLSRNNFTGRIPAWIGFYDALGELNLERNSFSGTIPKAMGSLTDLDTLSLGDNNFSGTLPEEIGLLNQLIRLNITKNQFEWTIPDTLGSLTNLEVLDLSSNHFVGSVPVVLNQLSNLDQLYLNDNYLTGDLTETFCTASSVGSIELFAADCLEPEASVTCECCTSCCNGQDCSAI